MSLRYVTPKDYAKLSFVGKIIEETLDKSGKVEFKQTNDGWKIRVRHYNPDWEIYKEFTDNEINTKSGMDIVRELSYMVIDALEDSLDEFGLFNND